MMQNLALIQDPALPPMWSFALSHIILWSIVLSIQPTHLRSCIRHIDAYRGWCILGFTTFITFGRAEIGTELAHAERPAFKKKQQKHDMPAIEGSCAEAKMS